ncbi:MAG TPA: carbohydrate-binding protein [Flavisolibacter sp.]|nr:carbohydrate-binding protein [Flavisolibacter sp.]
MKKHHHNLAFYAFSTFFLLACFFNAGAQSKPQLKTVVGQGEYQVLFIDSAKQLWGLGSNLTIGTNATGTIGVPQRVLVTPSNLKFKIATGALHHMGAVDTAGYVWTMGDNQQSQFGIGNANQSYMPHRITVDSAGNPFNNIVQLEGFYINSLAYNGFFAVKGDGTLWGWGRLRGGLRGNGTNIAQDNSRPVQIFIPGGRKVRQIVSGAFVIVLCTDGTVWTFGPTQGANLGYAASGNDALSPRQLTGLSNIRMVAGAGQFNYALGYNGVLYGWGAWSNFMGDNTYPSGGGLAYPTPRALTNITGSLPAPIDTIVVNSVCTHVILTDKSLWGWGYSPEGNVGNGVERDWKLFSPAYAYDFSYPASEKIRLPVRVAPTKNFAAVFGSNVFTFYTYALDTEGQLYCWGRNKASVLAVATRAGSDVLAAQRQSAWNRKWPTPVNPFSITVSYPSSSPDCVYGGASASPCNSYAIPANTKPQARAGSNQTISTSSIQLNGTASTDNVFIAYYEWSQLSGPSPSLIDLPASKTPIVSGLVPGTYTFKLKVTDNNWLSDSANVVITVNTLTSRPPVNQAPVANAGPDLTITLPVATAALNGSGTDPEGQSLGFQWRKISGPASLSLLNASSATASAQQLIQGMYEFELSVTDSGGLLAKDTMTITVKPKPNQPPVAEAGNGSTLTLPLNTLTLNGSGTDTDGTITAFQWTRVSGPSSLTWVNSNTGAALISGLTSGTYVLRLTVTDNEGATGSDDVTVVVNSAPLASPKPIPGKIEAEAYQAMNGINTQATSDSSAGQNVGWIDAGDWMDYFVSVSTAGAYQVAFRVASPNAGATLQLKKQDGSLLGTANIPQTGGWQTWTTINTTVNLTAGNQTIRVHAPTGGWNFNWMQFTMLVEPARYIKVNLFNGSNPYDNQEWNNWNLGTMAATAITTGPLLYADRSASAVTALLSKNEGMADHGTAYGGGMAPAEVLRHASFATTPRTLTLKGLSASKVYKIELYASRASQSGNKTIFTAGTASDTVSTYQNLTDKVIFSGLRADAQGQLVIGIDRTILYNYLNGFILTEETYTGGIAARNASLQPAAALNILTGARLFPNPASDRCLLEIGDDFRGRVSIELIDLNGKVVQAFTKEKDQPYLRVPLAIQNLPAGQYIVRVMMGEASAVIKLLRQ